MQQEEISTVPRLLVFVAASLALFGDGEANSAQLTLSWTDNAGGRVAFSIERSLGGDTLFAVIATVPPGVTSYVDTSVAEGSTYCYRVQAYDADLISDYSNEACASLNDTMDFVITVNLAGSGASAVGGARLTLSWIDNSNGLAATSIERRLISDTMFAAIASVPPGVTSFVDTSVTDGLTYCYRVQAAGGGDYSNEACASANSAAGAGTGTVTSTPDGINCRADCFATYPVGTVVTLTATPDSGSTFTGWSGSCSGTGPCTVVGNVSISVTATFCSTSSSQCQSQ